MVDWWIGGLQVSSKSLHDFRIVSLPHVDSAVAVL